MTRVEHAVEPPTEGASRRRESGSRLRTAAPYGLLVLGWLALFPFTRHYGNPDGSSYAVIAQRWLEGDWGDAVNGYWGPLLSWLMTPLLAVGVPGLLALRLVLLGAALLTLPPLRSLARRCGASPVAVDVVLLAAAPFLVYAALYGLYPDVLLALALLHCCDRLFRPSFATSARTALAAGAWGGVAYLAKAYAVPVVLVLIPLGAALHSRRAGGTGGRALLRQVGLALAGFGVFFLAWAGVLSATYGEPTFSTSAGYNSRLVAPGSLGNPLTLPGVYVPQDPDALSVWEEPSRLQIPQRADGAPGRPGGQQVEAAGSRLETAARNLLVAGGNVVVRGLPFVVLALVAVVAYVRARRRPDPVVTGTLLAGAVSAGGLVLIVAIERYMWFAILALVPAAAVGLDVVLRRRRGALPAIAAVVVTVAAATSLLGLLPRWNADREVTQAVAALQEQGGLTGIVATAGDWQPTQLLCYQLQCQYAGSPVARDAAGVATELAGAGVAHLVVWDEDEGVISGLPPAPGPGLLTIYDVTAAGLQSPRRVTELAD